MHAAEGRGEMRGGGGGEGGCSHQLCSGQHGVWIPDHKTLSLLVCCQVAIAAAPCQSNASMWPLHEGGTQSTAAKGNPVPV